MAFTHNVKLNTQNSVPVLLALLTIVCSWSYYALGYAPAVFASDRIQPLFYGYYKIEGSGSRIYRWTSGHGMLCLPAAGQQRPALELQLDLLGQSEAVGTHAFTVQVGSVALHLPLLERDRSYRVVLPPGPEYGPVCVTLVSAVSTPENDERRLGVGVRALELQRLPGTPAGVPPLDQLATNAGLAVGSYSLLRRWRVRVLSAGSLVALITLGVSVALISGRTRITADLPVMTLGATAAVVAILVTDTLRRDLGQRLAHRWARAWLGVLLTALLLLGALFGFQVLAGYPPGLYPLMARMGPTFSWEVVWPLLFFGVWLALVLRWLRAPTPPAAPLAIGVCWVAACALAVLLKAALREWDSLFQTFTWQPEDYIRDVHRVGDDPLGFLQQYVTLMPKLALHNRTHPPGGTLLLWAIERLAGPGPQVATWAVIGIAGLGVWPTYRLAQRAGGQQAALLAAAVYAVLPAQLIYGVTSLDAVFATVLAFAIEALVSLAQGGQGRTAVGGQGRTTVGGQGRTAVGGQGRTAVGGQGRTALQGVVAGAWIALGMVLTFSTLLLGLFAATLCICAIVTQWNAATLRRTAVQAILICATATLLLLGLWATTGYNSWAAFRQGNIDNAIDVQRRTPPPGLATYLYFLGANAIAYGIYLGPWALNLVSDESRRGIDTLFARKRTSPIVPAVADSVLVGLAVLLVGMLASGLFVREVERIWLFTHILVALATARGIMRRGTSLGQTRYAALVVSALFAQALFFRALMRIYW